MLTTNFLVERGRHFIDPGPGYVRILWSLYYSSKIWSDGPLMRGERVKRRLDQEMFGFYYLYIIHPKFEMVGQW